MNRGLAIVFALAPATLTAQSLEGWEKTRWGMTQAEVREVYGAAVQPPAFEGAPLVVDSVSIGDTNFTATLYFSESHPRLHYVALSPARDEITRELFDVVFNTLVARHGRPAIDRRAAWDTAESRQSSWRLGPTAIHLELVSRIGFGGWRFSYAPTRGAVFGGDIPYLEPAAFKNITARLKQRLEKLGCRIPQPWSDRGPENVISGRFLSPKERSWAVLCSRAGTSAVLVFSGPKVELRATLEPGLDSNLFGDFEYLRRISVADRDFILRHDEMYGNDPPLPNLDHDGIDDAFVGKGSSILFFDGKEWRHLAGAD